MTELMAKYMEVQERYPKAVVLVRLGDFYEALGESAKYCAARFDLTLTSRNIGLSERTPMCGFPFHQYESFVSQLVIDGKKVVVLEDVQNVQVKEPESNARYIVTLDSNYVRDAQMYHGDMGDTDEREEAWEDCDSDIVLGIVRASNASEARSKVAGLHCVKYEATTAYEIRR